MSQDYIPLATITLASASSGITFSNIPATPYRDLIIVCDSLNASGNLNLVMRFNGDSGSNYLNVHMSGDGSSTASGSNTTTQIGLDSRGFGNASTKHTHIIQIMDYGVTDKHKTVLTRADNSALGLDAFASRWANTAAVNSINIFYPGANINSGGRFDLYGIVG